MRLRPVVALAPLLLTLSGPLAHTQEPGRRPLASTHLDQLAELLKLEETRTFDEPALARLLGSTHPEVRRRAALTVGRVVDPRGRALLSRLRVDGDLDVVAMVAFSSGQLKDPDAVPWLAETLSATTANPDIAREAARSLGKIRTPDARVALARYLASAPATPAASAAIGEALLAIGRFTTREDLAPITRWVDATDAEVRWRAAWALFRPRDPAAFPHLLQLSRDASADVRFWAVRGLAAPPANADSTGFDRERAADRLRETLADPDRRVRTESLRALLTYDSDAALAAALDALDSPDTWLSVSAAESLGRFASRAPTFAPRLIAATAPARSTALRVTALTPLMTIAPEQAVEAAAALVRSKSVVAREAAVAALGRLGEPGRLRLAALAADPETSSLLPAPGQNRPRTPPAPRSDAEYRQLVERWIVPAYHGAPGPRVLLDTPRGTIEIELHAGDAPLGLEHFRRVVESGEIIGVEFGRVVPNFVVQQRAIRNDVTLRDEVNRRGLNRGTLSWASAGLDTGRPGYTLGSTPQPHNEGDFTALGRVVAGIEVVDRLELGDAFTGARMRR